MVPEDLITFWHGRAGKTVTDSYSKLKHVEPCHKAGMRNISHKFYEGGRHEMLNELNRGQVRTNLLAWISVVLQPKAHLNI